MAKTKYSFKLNSSKHRLGAEAPEALCLPAKRCSTFTHLFVSRALAVGCGWYLFASTLPWTCQAVYWLDDWALTSRAARVRHSKVINATPPNAHMFAHHLIQSHLTHFAPAFRQQSWLRTRQNRCEEWSPRQRSLGMHRQQIACCEFNLMMYWTRLQIPLILALALDHFHKFIKWKTQVKSGAFRPSVWLQSKQRTQFQKHTQFTRYSWVKH